MKETKKVETLDRSSANLLADAVNDVTKKDSNVTDNLENFVKKVGAKFIERKLDEFPMICAETRRVNYLKRRQFEAIQNAGGWSEKKTFKFDYEIPRSLYFFMQNLVYRDFWTEENEKHWRPFMRAILSGQDPEQVLVRTKMKFGSNKDTSLIY